MTRVTFLEPPGELTPALVGHALRLVVLDEPASAQIAHWTPAELLMAYDWAMREHLHASDNHSVRRRPRPSFTIGDPA